MAAKSRSRCLPEAGTKYLNKVHKFMGIIQERLLPPDITTTARAPPWFRSLDFGERNRYLKGPARFCSLDFGKCNGYLKGVTHIDAQQKSMAL